MMADSVGSGQCTPSRTREIFGVTVHDIHEADALDMLFKAIADEQHLKIAFLNTHGANLAWSDAALMDLLKQFVVLADGVGVDIAARTLTGASFSANLNGTDFIPQLVRSAPRQLRIALFGGRPGVAQRAAAALLAQDRRHEITLVADGYGDAEATRRYLSALEAAPVDLLLVAMGNPLQERWIAANVDARHAHVAAGVGALLDFLSGEVPRAPESLRLLRLEWLYRLAIEPRRMFRRYVLGIPLFLLRLAMVKMGMRRF
jgi:exopolysaccharide biosynthesis WecB/TagA/CpsF family protein